MEGDADGELVFYDADGQRLAPGRSGNGDGDPAGYTPEQAKLLDIIGNRGGWHPDVLIAQSGLSPQRVQIAITQLELLGRVTRDLAFRIHPS